MRTFQLASTDLHPSRLALGTMHLGQTWDREPVTADAIKAGCTLLEEAVELGITSGP